MIINCICKPLNTSFNRRITVAQTGSLLRRQLKSFLFSNWKIRKSNKLKLKNIRKKLGNEISLRVKQKDRKDPFEFNPKRETKSTKRLLISLKPQGCLSRWWKTSWPEASAGSGPSCRVTPSTQSKFDFKRCLHLNPVTEIAKNIDVHSFANCFEGITWGCEKI